MSCIGFPPTSYTSTPLFSPPTTTSPIFNSSVLAPGRDPSSFRLRSASYTSSASLARALNFPNLSANASSCVTDSGSGCTCFTLAPPFARTRSPTLRSHANPRPLSRPLASPRPLVPLVLGLVLGSLVVAFVSVSDRAFSTTDRAIAYRASPASSFGAPRVVVVARRVGAVAIERGRGALDRRAMPSMRVARVLETSRATRRVATRGAVDARSGVRSN